jgi:flagellar protein FlaF
MYGRNNAQSYLSLQKDSLEGRELEANALLNLAQSLQRCQETDTWGTAEALGELDETLRRNQRLWTVFQVELESPTHPMPTELRVNLLRLVRYVDSTTFMLLARPQKERLQSLIQINRTIAEGLLSNVAAGAPVEAESHSESMEIEF